MVVRGETNQCVGGDPALRELLDGAIEFEHLRALEFVTNQALHRGRRLQSLARPGRDAVAR